MARISKPQTPTTDAPPQLMCEGISQAWRPRYRGEPHEVIGNEHPNCWKCGANLGCFRCSGRRDELLCMNGSGKKASGGFFGHGELNGPVWATTKAFAKHGLFLGQKLEQYPAEFQRAYDGEQR
jgi:hypothetical protein